MLLSYVEYTPDPYKVTVSPEATGVPICKSPVVSIFAKAKLYPWVPPPPKWALIAVEYGNVNGTLPIIFHASNDAVYFMVKVNTNTFLSAQML